jgi:AcrR family transcriptional regulator
MKASVARTRPADRFRQLLAAGTQVFIDSGGFRRTQIGDVARALGVAKGTIYLYVESKEALFDLVLRHADRPGLPEPALPVPTPGPGATVAYLRERMATEASFPALAAAERRAGPATTMAAELGAIAGEIIAVLTANRTAIKLIGTSANDMPELAELWFQRARGGVNRRLSRYLERRAAEGLLRPAPSPVATARFITETASWFAVHRHWDPHPDPIDEDTARQTVRVAVLRTLLPAAEAP